MLVGVAVLVLQASASCAFQCNPFSTNNQNVKEPKRVEKVLVVAFFSEDSNQIEKLKKINAFTLYKA